MPENQDVIDDRLGSSSLVRRISSLLNRINLGSSEEDRIQSSLETFRSILNNVNNTISGLNELESITEFRPRELDGYLNELRELSMKVLDSNQEVSREESLRFNQLTGLIDGLIDDTEVEGVALRSFLVEFSKVSGQRNLGNRTLGQTLVKASKEIGEDFSQFFTDNVKAISTSEVGQATKSTIIASLAGPLSPLVSAVSDVIDPSSVFNAAKSVFSKLKRPKNLLEGREGAEEGVEDSIENLDDSITEASESINELSDNIEILNQDRIEPTSEVDRIEPSDRVDGDASQVNDLSSLITYLDKIENSLFLNNLSFERQLLEDEEFRILLIESNLENTEAIINKLEELRAASDDGGGILSSLNSALGSFAASTGRLFSNLFNSLKKFLAPLLTLAKPLGLLSVAAAAGFGIGTLLNNFLDNLTGGKFGKFVGDLIGPPIDAIKEAVSNFSLENLAGFFNEIFTDVISRIEVVFTDIKNGIANTFDGVLAFLGFSSAEERIAARKDPVAAQQLALTNKINELITESQETGFFGVGGFEAVEFDRLSNELKELRGSLSEEGRIIAIQKQLDALRGIDLTQIEAESAIKVTDQIISLNRELRAAFKPVEEPKPQQVEPPELSDARMRSEESRVSAESNDRPINIITQNPKKDAKSTSMSNDDLGLNLVHIGMP